MGQVLPELDQIPENVRVPAVRQARRLLDGSYQSVDDNLAATKVLDGVRRTENGSKRDVLRSAKLIYFGPHWSFLLRVLMPR